MSETDRDQIRQDATEVITHGTHVHEDLPAIVANHCLALLTELEQTEKQRDELAAYKQRAITNLREDAEQAERIERALEHAEHRLAKTPALVEALEFYANNTNWTQTTGWGSRIFDDQSDAIADLGNRARVALAAWEAD